MFTFEYSSSYVFGKVANMILNHVYDVYDFEPCTVKFFKSKK